MEADEDQQYPSHNVNLFDGNPSPNNNFNSMFQPNPQDEDVHVHDYVDNHEHYRHQQPYVVTDQEKRLRRLATNRESARRSRMRERMMKQVLQMQVKQLMASNQLLSNKYTVLACWSTITRSCKRIHSSKRQFLPFMINILYLMENMKIYLETSMISIQINNLRINQLNW